MNAQRIRFQKGLGQEQYQHPHSLSRLWQRLVLSGVIVAGLLWSILAVFGGLCGLTLQHNLLDLWRRPSELSWSDLGWCSSMRHYVSFKLPSPVPEFLGSDARCEPGLIFSTPGGRSLLILDSQGELVWTAQSSVDIDNLRVQNYRGQDFLTYWASQPSGPGYYHMLDASYNVRYVVSPVGDILGLSHDLTITSRDTALITAHDKQRADLSSIGGPKDGWIMDGIVQEIEIASGKLVFEWRASHHVPVTQSYNRLEHGHGTEDQPYDYFHIINADQDAEGNYVISAGHIRAVSCIERTTGEVLWSLGGKANNFMDYGERPMAQFKWPHGARWYDNDTLTVLDIDGDHSLGSAPTESRGMLIQLDVPKRVADVRHTYIRPEKERTPSEGNMQLLEDTSNIFIGWGGYAGYSEFSTDGTALCDVRFGRTHSFSKYGGLSRVFKGPWTGKPTGQPVAYATGGKIYVHWNGATEVATWQLQAQSRRNQVSSDADAFYEAGEFYSIARFQKIGFETALDARHFDRETTFRVVALDRKGNELGHTAVFALENSWAAALGLSYAQLGAVTGLCLVGGMILVVSALYWRLERKQWDDVRWDIKR